MSEASSESEDPLTRKIESMLVRSIAGCTALGSAERQSGGAAQETYRLSVIIDGREQVLALRRANGGQYVRPSEGHPGLATEALLMRCAVEAGIPAPQVHYVLTPDDDLGDGIVMSWVEGESLGAKIVRSDEFAVVRPTLARECGRILARIHGIDLDKTGLRGRLSVITPERFVQRMWDRYIAFDTPQPMIDYTARWLMANLPDNVEMTLVHSEFRNGNFMINADGIVAVLDWEEAHIGDPMRDFGWLCTNSWRYGGPGPVGGFGEYADLFQGYEEESGKSVDRDRVRFWEVFGAFWWAVVSLGLAHQVRSGQDPSVERAAIGRRTTEAQVDCVNLIIPGSLEEVSPDSSETTTDLPSAAELISVISAYLRSEVMPAVTGRNSFLARVAANGLDIVAREIISGPALRLRETERLQALLATDEGSLDELRWGLVRALRRGERALDDEALVSHLRNTVVGQASINQPKYSGYQAALERDS
jgi:aminoglycoside phosphotransferase (APT) family kinase protein